MTAVRKTGRLFKELHINRKYLDFEENFIIGEELRKFQLYFLFPKLST